MSESKSSPSSSISIIFRVSSSSKYISYNSSMGSSQFMTTYEIYMEQPKGFEEGGMDYVWKLKKTLYGMMQGAYN